MSKNTLTGYRLAAMAACLPALLGAATVRPPHVRTDALPTHYSGPMAGSLASGQATPLAMVSADFNEDGFPDLAALYQTPAGAGVAIHLGRAVVAGGQPFAAEAATVAVSSTVGWLAAGDFDADGHMDLAMSAPGSRTLIFLPGDGRGGFGEARAIELPGPATAFLSGDFNRADGLADIALAVNAPAGPELMIFESAHGALAAPPEAIALKESVDALALGRSSRGGFVDLFARNGHHAYRIAGRDRQLYLAEAARHAAAASVSAIAANQYPASAPAATGVIASLAVRFSGSRAGSRVELHAGSAAPQVVHADGIGYVVNNAGTAGDGDLTDGICDTGNAVSGFTGQCTLYAAIEQADHNNAPVTITFDPALSVIQVGTQLPDITVNAVIDGLSGRTQRMELDGRNATGGEQIYDPSGLSIYGGNSTVTGMTIYGFFTGIKIELQPENVIENCWIGVDGTGSVPGGRSLNDGILVETGDNLIGGTAAGQGNVIVAPATYGIGVVLSADNNIVQGNRIGTDPSGETLIGTTYGVDISDSNSNAIGGTATGAGNLISGGASSSTCTTCAAVLVGAVNAPANNNLIQGNYIGIDASGSTAFGNPEIGINLSAQLATVGGTTPGARNVISGNAQGGVLIGDPYALVEGNYIGTDATGSTALANGNFGLELNGLGAVVGPGNVISGNNGPGVLAYGAYNQGAAITGNTIGLNAAGSAALPNSGDGILIPSGASNYGPLIAANVISGNAGNGVNLTGSFVTLQGNWIGTNAAATSAIGNALDGVHLIVGYAPVIGGSATGNGNVISGNSGNGLTLNNTGSSTIQGNWIGTDPTGTATLGNGGIGIDMMNYSYYNNVTGNTVANNAQTGVTIDTSLYVTVRSNSIFQNHAGGIVLLNNANYNIAAPVLSSASLSGGMLTLNGSIANAPGGFPATIDVYNNSGADSPAEGRQYLGSATLNATGGFSIAVAAASASVVTATVTDNLSDTSAFSNGVSSFAGSLSLSLTSPVIGGNASTTNTVKLSQPAPAGGLTVNLNSLDTDVVTVPASVTVPAGQTVSQAFTITTYGVAATTQVTIQASFGTQTASAKVAVKPAALSSVVLSPASAVGGATTVSNSVHLSGFAPPAGAVVALSSSNPSLASVPNSVTVPANAKTVDFQITLPEGVSANTQVTISATYLSVTKTATLTIVPPAVKSVTLSKASVKGGRSLAGNTVTLTGLAPAGGFTVMLSSSDPSVAAPPASVTVSASGTTAQFTTSTSAVTSSTHVTITATSGAVSKNAHLTVTP